MEPHPLNVSYILITILLLTVLYHNTAVNSQPLLGTLEATVNVATTSKRVKQMHLPEPLLVTTFKLCARVT